MISNIFSRTHLNIPSAVSCIRCRSMTDAESFVIGRGVLLTTTRSNHCSQLQLRNYYRKVSNLGGGSSGWWAIKPLTLYVLRETPSQKVVSLLDVQRSLESVNRITTLALFAPMSAKMLQWHRRPFDQRPYLKLSLYYPLRFERMIMKSLHIPHRVE